MDFEKKLLEAINNYRVQNGLKKLTISKSLNDYVKQHNALMKQDSKLYHMCPTHMRQNLCFGRKNYIEKPHLSLDIWVQEKGHRDVILDPKLSYIGIGYILMHDSLHYIINTTFE